MWFEQVIRTLHQLWDGSIGVDAANIRVLGMRHFEMVGFNDQVNPFLYCGMLVMLWHCTFLTPITTKCMPQPYASRNKVHATTLCQSLGNFGIFFTSYAFAPMYLFELDTGGTFAARKCINTRRQVRCSRVAPSYTDVAFNHA